MKSRNSVSYTSRFAVLGVSLSCCAMVLADSATPLKTVRVASGLNRPIFVTAAPGDFDRMFIVEQRGVIKVLDLTTNMVLATPFLNIDSRVLGPTTGNDERGLLGMAFHPDWANNGFFFLNYVNNGRNTVVARFKISDGDPNVADPGSEVVAITYFQPFDNHNGGWIDFGPNDGHLYIATGDGGAGNDPANRAQDITNQLLGKMLRINVDELPYTIPVDNPFVGETGDDEIWAYGLRNPWRSSFDRANGDLYIADVGQNQREEIDFQPASSKGGENYGWRCMEANRCTGLTGCTCNSEDLTDPIHEYTHAIGFSITGGYVYRGTAIPDLAGTYFFSDFVTVHIWSFRYVDPDVTEFIERTSELANEFFINQVASFGEDAAGEMYIVDRGSTSSGQIFKIVPAIPAIAIVHGNSDWDRDDPQTWVSFNEHAFGGYVDPKVESTDGTNVDLGLNTFNVVFNTEPFGDAVGGPVTLANVTVEQTGGAAPNVSSVVKNDETVTVELDRNITIQEWTTLVWDVWSSDGVQIVDNGNEGEGVDEGARLDVAFVPGDVNSSGTNQPVDLNRWLNSWNGGDPIFPSDVENGHPDDYLDISRSGGAQPQDLNLLIRSMKGQDPFIRNWRNVGVNSPRP